MAQQGLPKPPLHDPQWSYQWREWLRRVYVRAAEPAQILWTQISAGAGEILWSQVSKVGSNLTDLATRRHRDLQDLQGGTTDEYYHITSAQHAEVTGFFAATDITGAEAETLTDGSLATSLHTHLSEHVLLTSDGDFIKSSSDDVIVGYP